MDMNCPACGKTFRSMLAEARHRHNFPYMCARNARFREWEKEMAQLEAKKQEECCSRCRGPLVLNFEDEVLEWARAIRTRFNESDMICPSCLLEVYGDVVDP